MAIVNHHIVNGTSRSVLDLISQAYNESVAYSANASKVTLFGGGGETLAEAYGEFTGSAASLGGFVRYLFLFDFQADSSAIRVTFSLTPTPASTVSPIFDTSRTLFFDAGTIAFNLLAGSDDISGTDVADQLLGFDGNDFITAGAGDDFAFGGADDDHILGQAGIDSLAGASGDDFLDGGDDADDLDGGLGDDTLLGRNGADTLNGGVGADVIVGGAGVDTVRFIAQSTVNILKPGQSSGEAKGDEYSSVEIFSFDTGNDRFIGGTAAESVLGNLGLDDLRGGGGNDFLRGEAGNDTLGGGDGKDTLRGGAGDDTLIDDAGADTIEGEAGSDTVLLPNAAARIDLAKQSLNSGSTAGDRFTGIEIFRFGNGGDNFAGSNAAETVFGNGGNDTLVGRGGNDTLNGGPGSDRLTGNAGADRFVFAGEVGADTITGFARGADKLAVSKSGFGFTTLRLVANANPVATTNAATFLFDTDNGHCATTTTARGVAGYRWSRRCRTFTASPRETSFSSPEPRSLPVPVARGDRLNEAGSRWQGTSADVERCGCSLRATSTTGTVLSALPLGRRFFFAT